MSGVLILAVVLALLALLALLVAAGVAVACLSGRLLPGDRRATRHRAARWQAEAQIDAITRQTLQAMRDAAYGASRRR